MLHWVWVTFCPLTIPWDKMIDIGIFCPQSLHKQNVAEMLNLSKFWPETEHDGNMILICDICLPTRLGFDHKMKFRTEYKQI